MIKFNCYRLGDIVFETNFIRKQKYEHYGPIQIVREIRTGNLIIVDSSRRIIPESTRGQSVGSDFLNDKIQSGDRYNLCYFCSSEKLKKFIETHSHVKSVSREEHELVDKNLYRVLVL